MPRIFNLAILEDNDQHYKFLEQLIRNQPEGFQIEYRIERFAEAAEAESKLFGRAPDLLLLDLNVLDSSGFETLKRFDKLKAGIVVMTVLEDVEIARKCMQEGAFYLVKDWIFNNPLLLHLFLLRAYDIVTQREKIKILIKERLGEFKKLIPRCSFCIGRIGVERFKDEATEEWYTFVNYIENLGIKFTDGICVDCFEEMRKAMEENGHSHSESS